MLSQLPVAQIKDDKASPKSKDKDQKQVIKNFSLFKIVWELSGMYKDILENGSAIFTMLKSILVNWEGAIAKIQKIMEEDIAPIIAAADDIDAKDKNSPSLNTAWGMFTKNIKRMGADVTKLKYALSDEKTTEKSLVADATEILKQIPSLLDSFDSLGLSAKLKELLPNSLDSFKASIDKFVTDNILNIIPPNLIKKLKEHHIKSGSLTLKQFADMDDFQQDIILCLEYQANAMMRDLFVYLDKLSIELSVKEGFFANLKLDFLGNKSLAELCENFTNAYQEQMRIAGYPIEEELYPYPRTINAQRIKLLQDVNKNLQPSEEIVLGEEKIAKDKSIELIDSRILAINSEFITINDTRPLLEKLKIGLQIPGADIKSALKHMKQEELTALRKSDNAPALAKIEEIYSQLEKLKAQKCAHFLIKKKNLEKRLQKNALDLKHVKSQVIESKLNEEEKRERLVASVLERANKGLTPKLQDTIDRKMARILGKERVSNAEKKYDKKSDPNSVSNIVLHIEKQMQDMLDKDVYETFFKESEGNPTRLVSEKLHIDGIPSYNLIAEYQDESKKEKDAPWIKHFGHTMAGVKKCITSLNKTLSDKKLIPVKEKHPALNLKKKIDVMEVALDNVNNANDGFDLLIEHPFVRQFMSAPGIEAYAKSLLNPMRNNIKNELTLSKNAKESKEVKEAAGLEGILNRIQQFYNQHNNDQSDQAKAALPKAFMGLIHSLEAWQRRSSDSLEQLGEWDYLVFAYRNKDAIFSELLGNASLAIASLRDVSKEFAMEMAQKFNLFLRDFFLVLDKVEIQFYLKEGYISHLEIFGKKSLSDLAKEFQAMIEGNGYQFKPEERFPYLVKMKEQRQSMQAQSEISYDQKFIGSRVKSAEASLAADTAVDDAKRAKQVKDNADKDKAQISARYLSKIKELEEEAIKSPSVTKDKKIRLLKSLLEKIDGSFLRVDEQLNKMSMHHMDGPKYHFIQEQGDSKEPEMVRHVEQMAQNAIEDIDFYNRTIDDIHLLYEGRTADIIKELRYVGTTKADVLNKIDLEIELLKQKRLETFYVNVQSRRTTLEDSIAALSVLRQWMQKPGYSYDDAIAEMKTKENMAHYDVLFQEQNAILREICKLDKLVAPESRGKKPINLTKDLLVTSTSQSKPLMVANDADLKHIDLKHSHVKVPDYYDTLIKNRIGELRNSFIVTSTKATKINLLNELRNNLNEVSLDDAIEKVRQNPANKTTFYLLFEGKTGQMMKEVQYSQLSKAKILHRIELEIIRLQGMRTERLCFSAQSRKQILEQRIHALMKLQKVLGDLSDDEIKQPEEHVLNLGRNKVRDILGARYLNILFQHEQPLLKDLDLWHQSRIKLGDLSVSVQRCTK